MRGVHGKYKALQSSTSLLSCASATKDFMKINRSNNLLTPCEQKWQIMVINIHVLNNIPGPHSHSFVVLSRPIN